MKARLTWVATLMISALAFADWEEPRLLHLPADVNGYQLQRYSQQNGIQIQKFGKANKTENDLIIEIGAKNLEWLTLINASRPANQQIALVVKNGPSSYPIDKPFVYGPQIISSLYKEYKSTFPTEFTKVVFGSDPISSRLPLPEQEYAKFAAWTDRLYQMAVRWNFYLPSKLALKRNRQNDVRGYYYLNRINDLGTKLERFLSLSKTEQETLFEYLMGICLNTEGIGPRCSKLLKVAIKNEDVRTFFNDYWPRAQRLYQSYFKVQTPRTDVQWSAADPNRMVVPFLDPQNSAIHQFLLNIEDEWSLGNWGLSLLFSKAAEIKITFQPNVVPHVKNSSNIVMNQNESLDSPDNQWTIRHEFGHVLGFPDCYLEFYESDKDEIIQYELAAGNLMCSSRGRFQQSHFDELKAAYYR